MALSIVHFLLTLILSLSIVSCNKDETKKEAEVNTLENQINTKFFDEISPASTLNCFQGAYYRKAVSSVDNWLGIEGKVILPALIYDLSRENPNKPGTYLDNASIYLGGTSDGQETDIGLTWEIIKDANGNISTERKAYRPFMRRTAHKSGQLAIYKNAPAESKYYWYPGDTISMKIVLTDPGKLLFTVSGSGKKFEEMFEVAGYQYTQKAQYKRVNAIDQVANEGKPVQSTKAKALGAKWLDVSIYRYYKSDALKVPFHPNRYTDMRCPDQKHFEINVPSDSKTAESINIFGTREPN